MTEPAIKSGRLRRGFRVIGLFSLTLLLVFAMLAWYVGGQLVEAANCVVGPPPNDLPIRSLTINSESGSVLAAWEIDTPNSQATIVLLHPIRSDRRAMLERARMLHREGFSVLMVDLQGHGESAGKNITLGHLEKHDVRSAVSYVKRNRSDHQIGIIGWSLGGAATLLAMPIEVDAVVIESVYTTVSQAVHDRVGMRLGWAKYLLSPMLLCQLRPRLGIKQADLRPIDFVDAIGCPILIASGSEDLHTPLVTTRELFSAAVEPKKLVIFEGAAHENLQAYDSDLYEREVLGFLKSALFSTQDGSEAIE